jgi:hypothetical protein
VRGGAMPVVDEVRYYAFQLEGGRYYIGHGSLSILMVDAMVDASDTEWVRLYPIIFPVEWLTADPLYEDTLVLNYMKKFGIANVRGGSYSLKNLTADQIHHLEKLISPNNNNNNNTSKLKKSKKIRDF